MKGPLLTFDDTNNYLEITGCKVGIGRKPLAYVSGPYSAGAKKKQIANIDAARRIAAELWDRGYTVICPHSNTAFFENLCVVADYDDFLRGDL